MSRITLLPQILQKYRGPAYSIPEPWRTLIRILIIYSVLMLIVETEMLRSQHSRAGHPVFLWSERVVAGVFTWEYLYRWRHARTWWLYPFSLMALVDLLAILPFWLGFFVADETWLHSIRTLRILRLTKLWRHNPTLDLIWKELVASGEQIKAVLIVLLPVALMGAFGIMEFESHPQPEKFGTLVDALWYVLVTVATVGYGDSYPVTRGGQLIAFVLIAAGVCVYGALVGIIGGAFQAAHKQEQQEKE